MDGKGVRTPHRCRESRPRRHRRSQRVRRLWTQGPLSRKYELLFVSLLEKKFRVFHVLLLGSQEKGNQYVKMGKTHYSDAIDCYTRAIDQKVLSDSETSLLFSNRAHVNLLLGNYRRALTDSEEALKLSPTNIKVSFLSLSRVFSFFFSVKEEILSKLFGKLLMII